MVVWYGSTLLSKGSALLVTGLNPAWLRLRWNPKYQIAAAAPSTTGTPTPTPTPIPMSRFFFELSPSLFTLDFGFRPDVLVGLLLPVLEGVGATVLTRTTVEPPTLTTVVLTLRLLEESDVEAWLVVGREELVTEGELVRELDSELV